MQRYKLFAEIVIEAENEQDAIWHATQGIFAGKGVFGCSVDSHEMGRDNYKVKGPNAINVVPQKNEICVKSKLFNGIAKKPGRPGTAIIATRTNSGVEEKYASITKAAAKLNISEAVIKRALSGKIVAAAGRTWRRDDT